MPKSNVVVVTGVSSGIGQVVSAKLAAQGHRVFGTVRAVAQALPIPGVRFVGMDVRNDASVDSAIQAVLRDAGRIDILINNAGTSLIGAVEETNTSEAMSLFETNVFGILRTSRAVLPAMRSQGGGRIVNISSVLGFLPAPYMGLYSASKHAVEGLSESLDHEVRQFNIRVTLIEPSYTRTKLDANSPRATTVIGAYARERELASRAIVHSVNSAPEPEAVADTIVSAAFGPWRMRRTPGGQASLLRTLRRYMPAGPVDSSLRKTFGLT